MAFSNPLTFATIVQAYEFELYDTSGTLVAELAPMDATPSWFAGIGLAMLHGNPSVADSALRWSRKGTGGEQVVLAGPSPAGDSIGTAVELDYNPSTDFYSAQVRAVDLDGPTSGIMQTYSSAVEGAAGLVAFSDGGDASMGVRSERVGVPFAEIEVWSPTFGTSTWRFDERGRLWLEDKTGAGLTADGTNVWRLSGDTLFGPNNYGGLRTRNEATTGPSYMTGMVLRGLGWAFWSDFFGSYRMGYRGNASGMGYAWCADGMIVGSAPNDSLDTHTLRVQGTGWFNSSLTSNGTFTANGAANVGGNLTANGSVTGTNGVLSTKTAGALWNNASIVVDASSVASLALRVPGFAPQFRVGTGGDIVYLRNSNDSLWAQLEGILVNHSSRRSKQDIAPFAQSALEKLDRLQPVTYRWNRDGYLTQLPTGRRGEALDRLNAYADRNGLPYYDGRGIRHECGRDCDGSEAQPCARVLDWQKGQFGLIAEDTGEVMPELAHLGPDGEYDGLDALAVAALAVAGIKELTAKLDTLEKRLAAIESR